MWAVLSVFLAIGAIMGGGIILVLKWVLEKQYASFRDGPGRPANLRQQGNRQARTDPHGVP